ncbi:MAG: NAD kinase [Rhodospirillaceae bacterium]
MNPENVAFVAADTPAAQEALLRFRHRYGHMPPDTADVIVAFGGDGFMLESLHRFMALGKPIYGMHRGTVGFLMNAFDEDDLPRRLQRAQPVTLHPLRMTVETVAGETVEALAINEVSLLRETRQAAKLRITIDGRERLSELVCDGVLVCTAAGSTAYNLSAHGPILPMGANVMALTPISAFRPRRWRGAILPQRAAVRIDILDSDKRPVSAVADYTEVRDVRRVDVREDRSVILSILFDPEHNLEERILSEQFMA